MTNKIVNTTVEILGKPYPIRCPEEEVDALKHAAEYLHQKMAEVQESGKAINLERIAIITALNMAYQFLQIDLQKNTFTDKINQRISRLQDKLDTALKEAKQTEFVYSAE